MVLKVCCQFHLKAMMVNINFQEEIKLKYMNVISLYDITFIYFYTGLDTADNILFRTNYNQDTLDNHITIDPNEYRRQ